MKGLILFLSVWIAGASLNMVPSIGQAAEPFGPFENFGKNQLSEAMAQDKEQNLLNFMSGFLINYNTMATDHANKILFNYDDSVFSLEKGVRDIPNIKQQYIAAHLLRSIDKKQMSLRGFCSKWGASLKDPNDCDEVQKLQ